MPPHPNLVQTYGVSMDSDYPYIVLEYCEGGSLDKIVFSEVIKRKEQRSLVLGIAYGLMHLHTHKIVHRDLAVRNILVRSGDNNCFQYCSNKIFTKFSSKKARLKYL